MTGCLSVSQPQTATREVPTQTMEQILTAEELRELVPTLNNTQSILLKTWLKDDLIPYVSYLETELQHSTPID